MSIPSNVFGIYKTDTTETDFIIEEDIVLKDQVLASGYGELSEINGNLIINNEHSGTTTGQVILKTKNNLGVTNTFAFDECIHLTSYITALCRII